MTGWISLHRKVQDHEIFNEKRVYSRFEAWIYFLLNANHKEGKSVRNSNVIVVERGQLLTSKKKLREVFGWSNTKLNKFIEVLELERMIHTKSTSKYTVITIENYDFYQSEEGRKHSTKTSEEHQKNIRNTSETHQKHTNNNDNNELRINKNVNNENNTSNSTVEKSKYQYDDYGKITSLWQNLGFGFITERSSEMIGDWIKDYREDLIIEVLNYAHDMNKKNAHYVYTVLKKSKERGVKSAEDFRAENERFVQKQTHIPKNQSYQDRPLTQSEIEQREWQEEYGKQLLEQMKDVDMENLPF